MRGKMGKVKSYIMDVQGFGSSLTKMALVDQNATTTDVINAVKKTIS